MPAPTVPTETVRRELPAPNDSSTGNVVLSGTAVTITKPAGTRWIWICSTAVSYYRFGGSAAVVPAANTTTNGSMPLNPGNGLILDMKVFSSVSVIAATAVIGFAFYRDREGGILE
jgi:hypothetical protein